MVELPKAAKPAVQRIMVRSYSRSTLSLARARRGRTYRIFAQLTYVRPLRGRYVILLWNRRLRSLRSLHQRLWIFAAFGDALASDKIERGDTRLRYFSFIKCESSIYNKEKTEETTKQRKEIINKRRDYKEKRITRRENSQEEGIHKKRICKKRWD